MSNLLNDTVTRRIWVTARDHDLDHGLLVTANIKLKVYKPCQKQQFLKAETNTENKMSCFVRLQEWVEGTRCLEESILHGWDELKKLLDHAQ